MMYTLPDKTIKTIRPGDPDFMIYSGNIVSARAGFEISNDCPYNHLQILKTCIDRGWLKPVAHMKENEYVWEKIGE